jgi:hypothetical protein
MSDSLFSPSDPDMSIGSLGREGPEHEIEGIPAIGRVIQGDWDAGPAPVPDCHPARGGPSNRQPGSPCGEINVPAAVKPFPLIVRAAPGVGRMFVYDTS